VRLSPVGGVSPLADPATRASGRAPGTLVGTGVMVSVGSAPDEEDARRCDVAVGHAPPSRASSAAQDTRGSSPPLSSRVTAMMAAAETAVAMAMDAAPASIAGRIIAAW
jgi:hypothetical protein